MHVWDLNVKSGNCRLPKRRRRKKRAEDFELEVRAMTLIEK